MKKGFPYSFLAVALLLASIAQSAWAQSAGKTTGFEPLDRWVGAVVAGDAEVLKNFYSSDPPAQVSVNGITRAAEADISFWLGLKATGMNLEIVRLKQKPGAASVIFKAEVRVAGGETVNVTDAQGWRQQGDQWRIVGAERTDAPHLAQPSDMKKDLYPDTADARAEIKEAEEKAAKAHQRILLVFGANWCYDCHVLDLAFHRPDFASVMAGYEVVHVDIGDDGKKNSDVAKEFDTPLNKGIPALAVLEADGKVVISQKNGEFEDARSLTPEALLEFLNRWKPIRVALQGYKF
jgi:ketosteroid isomerase-like protein